jgi:hypothetical protein
MLRGVFGKRYADLHLENLQTLIRNIDYLNKQCDGQFLSPS